MGYELKKGEKMNNRLIKLGLNENINKEYKTKYENMILGRVSQEHKNIYKVMTHENIVNARVSGKFNFDAMDRMDYPAVGDWVVLEGDSSFENYIIKGVLTRKSVFTRKVAGDRLDEQIIASNIDYLFICMSLNNDFNIRKLERYITTAYNSGATPVIVLTKSDLCGDVEEKLVMVKEIAIGIDIKVTSSYLMDGIEDIRAYVKEGVTIAFSGSSGVGKSTLINTLSGEELQETGGIRNDDRGQHVTTYRNLIELKGGGIVIDTPGMREMQMLDIEESIEGSFSDIEMLIGQCKFSNCTHKSESGCMIVLALADGTLDKKRYDSYKKLKKEVALMAEKVKKKERALEKRNASSKSKKDGRASKHKKKYN